jgi:hypothetical protein
MFKFQQGSLIPDNNVEHSNSVPIQGVVGLPSNNSAFLSDLLNQRLISSKEFSFYLNRSGDGSMLTLGKPNRNTYSGEFICLKKVSNDTKWTVALTGLEVVSHQLTVQAAQNEFKLTLK